jgi:hypothetical protein
MDKDTRIYTCRCGNRLHIDFRARKVTILGNEGDVPEDLDELIAHQEKEAAVAKKKFDLAMEERAREKDRLEQLFNQARKKVAEEKDDEKPPSIFDLD